jgi:hypothetical protein
MVISGMESRSPLGASLFHALTAAAAGDVATRGGRFSGLAVERDKLEPEIGLYGAPIGSDFQDRTVTTTVDDITVKIDVARVAKGASADGAAAGTSATQTVHVRITHTVDPLSGQRTDEVVDAGAPSAGQLDPGTLDDVSRALHDGDGVMRGTASITDHRTVRHTYYKSALERNAQGQLQTVQRVSQDTSSFDFMDEANSAVALDGARTSATAAQLAQGLADQYSSDAFLQTHLPGLTISAHA